MKTRKRDVPTKTDAPILPENGDVTATPSPDNFERLLESSDRILKESFLSTSPRDWGKALNDAVSVEELVQVFEQTDPRSRAAVAQIGEKYFQSFKSFNIERDVERLEQLGVKRPTLTLAMFAIRLSRQFDGAFKEFGDRRSRDRQKRALLAPIPILRDMKKLFGELTGQFYAKRSSYSQGDIGV